MAPGYRTTGTNTRRGNRSGLAEHDDFEGLPVRQWRQQMVNVAPPPEREEAKKQDRWDVELPHGMPRDTHLLTPHNQELLRLARSGKLYKKRPLAEEEDGDGDGIPGPDKKDSAASEGYGYKVKKWVRLERSAEDAGINLLAPRHKNTITRPSKQLGTQVTGPMVTKATVKRLDAAGNPYTQEVIIPDGQAVDGEIISTSVVPAPEATGEVVLPVATPARRKPPIPQKKKGRGRGRGGRGRGRLPLAAPTRPVPQQDGSTEVKPEAVGPDGVKIEAEDAARAGGDLEMNESSALDDDDGDEGSGDDDDGDGDESATPAAEGEDQEMKDAPAHPPSASIAGAPPSTMSAVAAQPGANLAPPPLLTDRVQLEGSPLKNVTMRSPTDPSPHLSPIAATTTASTDAVLSGVPEPPAPVPAPAETVPEEDSRMDGVTSTNTESQGTGPGPIPHQPIIPSAEDTSAPPVAEPPPALEVPPAVGAAPVVEPSAVAEPPPQVEELPTVPPQEDVPLPSSEEPMPGQAAEISGQQVPAATEPAPPSPIIAPAPAPAPSPPPVAQVPAEEVKEVIEDVGISDVKAESGGGEDLRAEGEGVADVVVEDTGAADVVAETAGAEDAGAKATVVTDDAQVGETGTQGVNIEEVGTEDVVTEDGGFDILGSLSTSLNQQAEDDVPPPSLPSAPTDHATSEPALPVQSNEAAPALQPDETGQSGQTGETTEPVQTEQTGDIRAGGVEAQTQGLPERPGEEK